MAISIIRIPRPTTVVNVAPKQPVVNVVTSIGTVPSNKIPGFVTVPPPIIPPTLPKIPIPPGSSLVTVGLINLTNQVNTQLNANLVTNAIVSNVEAIASASIQDAHAVQQYVQTTKFQTLVAAGVKSASPKVNNTTSERAGENFITNDPELIFTSEYIINNTFCGVLICWEKYQNATHYEVYKKNVFQEDSQFERILFLDVASLEEEKKYFTGYIQGVLGFTGLDMGNCCVMLDDQVKQDRIYQYSVCAVNVPTSVTDVDYELIMRSHDQLNTVPVSSQGTTTIFDLAGTSLGSVDLAWIIALVNTNLSFFGRNALENNIASQLSANQIHPPISSGGGGGSGSGSGGIRATTQVIPRPITGNISVLIPKSPNQILAAIGAIRNIFGLSDTFSELLGLLGGLPDSFVSAFLASLDQKNNVFSYDIFKAEMQANFPVFTMLLDISASVQTKTVIPGGDILTTGINGTAELSKLGIALPSNSGTDSLGSIDSLTKIFKFVDQTLVAILYAQERGVFNQIDTLLTSVLQQNSSILQSTLNNALKGITGALASQVINSTNEVKQLYTPSSPNTGLGREIIPSAVAPPTTAQAKTGVLLPIGGVKAGINVR